MWSTNSRRWFSPLRRLALLLIFGLAAPAAADPCRDLELARDAQAFADAQAARVRDIALTNEIATLQARLQSEQAMANLQAQRSPPPLPALWIAPASPPLIDPAKLVSIPDAALAQSNARIRAAADNRR